MFLHVDLDAFYASVEQLDNPQLKGKPVIIGALPGTRRGVVSTCSYEARQYGVHSAMPVEAAYRLCPQGVFIPPRMKRYREKSREVMAVFYDFSPDVQQISIDEAFIDITGTERLFGPPETTARTLKAAVREHTGLTVSAGLAANRYVAKIASGMSKPDGFCHVPPGDEAQFIEQLPLEKIWGLGDKTRKKMHDAGLYTVSAVKNVSLELLEHILGTAGAMFVYNAVRGIDPGICTPVPLSRSISAEQTYEFSLYDRYIIDTALMELAGTVMFRMLNEGWHSRTVCVKLRYDDFTTHTIQETVDIPVTTEQALFTRASRLFDKKYTGGGIRLLGVGALNLEPESTPVQQELFDDGNKKLQTVERTVLQLKNKHPDLTITKARLLSRPETDTE